MKARIVVVEFVAPNGVVVGLSEWELPRVSDVAIGMIVDGSGDFGGPGRNPSAAEALAALTPSIAPLFATND